MVSNYPTLFQLFQKYNYDISLIKFKNPLKKFCCPIQDLEISDWGYFERGVHPKKLICTCYDCEVATVGFCHRYSKNFQNELELTYPDILNIEVNIDSFYLEPEPKDFRTSEKISEEEITRMYYQEIVNKNFDLKT